MVRHWRQVAVLVAAGVALAVAFQIASTGAGSWPRTGEPIEVTWRQGGCAGGSCNEPAAVATHLPAG